MNPVKHTQTPLLSLNFSFAVYVRVAGSIRDAGRRLGLFLPDRLQPLQNQRIADCCNRCVLEDGINVCLKHRRPLVGMVAVLPAVLVGAM
jgi:hypothetical protein